MPIFVLHCLNARIFPIFDKFVLYAFTVLENGPQVSLSGALTPSKTRYKDYQMWFVKLLGEAGTGPMSAQLNQLKELDSGIWAFGKRAYAISKKFSKLSELAENSLRAAVSLDASSDQFKQRAVDLKKSGLTNAQAIGQAAKELGIELKPSYAQYPGSHFNRWKAQGFV